MISMLLGCAKARLYPVQGPLSAQAPVPVFIARFTGTSNSGSVSVALTDGEICKGHLAAVPRPEVAKGSATATAPPTDMQAAWDAVYGSGFYVSHVLGSAIHVQAVVSGGRGTVRQGTEDATSIKGVAKDNKGNIYKLAF